MSSRACLNVFAAYLQNASMRVIFTKNIEYSSLISGRRVFNCLLYNQVTGNTL